MTTEEEYKYQEQKDWEAEQEYQESLSNEAKAMAEIESEQAKSEPQICKNCGHEVGLNIFNNFQHYDDEHEDSECLCETIELGVKPQPKGICLSCGHSKEIHSHHYNFKGIEGYGCEFQYFKSSYDGEDEQCECKQYECKNPQPQEDLTKESQQKETAEKLSELKDTLDLRWDLIGENIVIAEPDFFRLLSSCAKLNKSEGRKEAIKEIFDEIEKLICKIKDCPCGEGLEFQKLKKKYLGDEK